MSLWSIHSCFYGWKNYKQLLRNARVIVENKCFHFYGTHVCCCWSFDLKLVHLTLCNKGNIRGACIDTRWRHSLSLSNMFRLMRCRLLLLQFRVLFMFFSFEDSAKWKFYLNFRLQLLNFFCLKAINTCIISDSKIQSEKLHLLIFMLTATWLRAKVTQIHIVQNYSNACCHLANAKQTNVEESSRSHCTVLWSCELGSIEMSDSYSRCHSFILLFIQQCINNTLCPKNRSHFYFLNNSVKMNRF